MRFGFPAPRVVPWPSSYRSVSPRRSRSFSSVHWLTIPADSANHWQDSLPAITRRGSYRVVYEIIDKPPVIIVVRIDHRRTVYHR